MMTKKSSSSSEAPQEKRKSYSRSHDFKYIPSDALNVGISDSGLKIIFGIEEEGEEVTQLVGVQMNHQMALLLSNALKNAIHHYEEKSGNKISLPDAENITQD
ncbi:hypothetical protein ACW9UR_17270 [Halovulum sp. GXIMD14794]